MPETYCRQCGLFLPDLSKPVKHETLPEEHLKANATLSMLTILVSFILSFMLFLVLGFRSFTHPLIYVTAGLLIAIGAWHIQTFIRTLQLIRQWKRKDPLSEIQAAPPGVQAFKVASTAELLDQPDLSHAVPASVTEHTTRHLVETPEPKSR